MGEASPQGAARAGRPPSAAQALHALCEHPPGPSLPGARRRLPRQDRAHTRGDRHRLHPGADRRAVLRKAEGDNGPARRRRPGRGHDGLPKERDRAHRADRRRDVPVPEEEALLDRQGQRPRDLCPLAQDRDRLRRPPRARHRAEPHVRRQCRDAACPQPQPVRRVRDRKHVRRHPLRRDGGHLRIARHALLGVARRRQEFPRPSLRPIRARRRHRARHRRQGRRQPLRADPIGGAHAALQLRPGSRRLPDRGGREEGGHRGRPHGRHLLRRARPSARAPWPTQSSSAL